ncbi:MAG: AzlD domain-containing protein [Dehalococcoidia bacterium]
MIDELVAVLALGLGTWVIRAGFIVSSRGRELAVALDSWLTYARPAVLAGLLASLTMRGSAVDELGWPSYLVVVGAGLVVAVVTRSLTYALVGGALLLVVLA